MSFRPLVSVVMPVYNGSRYLHLAIESVLRQTYPNFEILVVNDGSTDDGATARVAGRYGKKLRYIEKPNGGVASALNTGLEKMKGDFFCWLSHDDIFLPHKLQRQVEMLEALNNRDVVLYSDYQIIDERSKVLGTRHLDNAMLMDKPLYSILRSAIHGCTLMIPVRAFKEVGTFDTSLRTTQDYALWFKMIRHFSFHHMPEVLVQGRVHSEQTTNTHPDIQRETNELWIDFARSTSIEEMLDCEASLYMFYRGLEKHLAITPYAQAHEYVKQLRKSEEAKIRESITQVKVSVIGFGAMNGSVFPPFKQNHTNLELLLPERDSEQHHQVKYFKRATNRIETLQAALEEATGDLVAFWDGNRWPSNRLSRQIEMLLKTGCGMVASGVSSCRPLFPRLLIRGSVDATEILVSRARLTQIIGEVADEQQLWFQLAKDDYRPEGDSKLRPLGYVEHFLDGTHRPSPHELVRRSAADILERLVSGEDRFWEGSSFSNFWVVRVGKAYLHLPELLREVAKRPVFSLLYRFRIVAEKERALREWALLSLPRRHR